MSELTERTCKACGHSKPLAEFYAPPNHLRCRACVKARSAQRYTTKRTKARTEALQGRLHDENGVPLTLDALTPEQREKALAAVTSEMNERRLLASKHPDVFNEDFKEGAVNGIAILTSHFPPKSCSCCRSMIDVEDRTTYRVCARCKYSVDICGRCVVHPGTGIFRPELQNVEAPSLDEVLAAFGENT